MYGGNIKFKPDSKTGGLVETLVIERRFVVDVERLDKEAGLKSMKYTTMTQAYLAFSEKNELKIRRKGDTHSQVVKQTVGEKTIVYERGISKMEFDLHMRNAKGNVIEKTRYVVPNRRNKFNIDVYGGNLSGLAIAEVRFESQEAADEFKPPAFFGREVTKDVNYFNSILALRGLPPDLDIKRP